MDPSDLLRGAMLQISESDLVRKAVVTAPVSRAVVARYVAGESVPDAVTVAGELRTTNRLATIDYLGEDTTDAVQAATTRDTYVHLLDLLAEADLTAYGAAEVSVKLSAIGQALPADGDAIALENARAICEAAQAAGTTVTLDMEDHTTTDRTLATLHALREDFPWVGAVLQSYLHRTEADCRDLATAGSRVRLCKGAYKEPASVAYQDGDDVDLSYVRCLKVLMAGDGYPMVASHDPRLIDIAAALAGHHGRAPDSYEFQMLLGIRMNEQKRIADRGHQMRVYVPFGEDWYGYLVRRMAERPANVQFFLRSLATNG
ncbi:MAG TPA: proline dehydrogenase family protein [Ornithinibacter sp.]|uniref:proline dehydrogenase family protein n=1 Tax=Ornithinibacter sp. TaxID=2862748 RepID=UPI002BA7E719|nr:proline dehydrogenase family protein [Ornithinibacter sp.]HOT55762.1 proline dehydrogenase family protein [Ornithinibacter sp.]HQV83237.1 proline dehydrogenase family protein [Ornithinibacter sp.]HRA26683.1 proline dehydrogenase family protein [Ornithinibacter sp.]